MNELANKTARGSIFLIACLLPLFIISWGRFGQKFIVAAVLSLVTGLLIWFICDVFSKESSVSKFHWQLFILFPLFIPLSMPLWIIPIVLTMAYIISISSFGGMGRHIFNPTIIATVVLITGYSATSSLLISRPFNNPTKGFQVWSSGLNPARTGPEIYSNLSIKNLIASSIGGKLPSYPGSLLAPIILAISFVYSITFKVGLTWWVSATTWLVIFSYTFPVFGANFSAFHLLSAGIIPTVILVCIADGHYTLPAKKMTQYLSGLAFALLSLLFLRTEIGDLSPIYAVLIVQLLFKPASSRENYSNA